jgi:hypothetical protein
MSESYRIVGQSVGEPQLPGRVGLRVRVPLSGHPSARWSRVLGGHLVNRLTGQPAVGHLQGLDSLVHADEIVLEGVEAPEAPHLLCDALPHAVEDANQACARAEARGRASGKRVSAPPVPTG